VPLTLSVLAIVFLVGVLLYLAEYLIFFAGVLAAARLTKPDASPTHSILPSVTVLVCARDEESNIGACVESLGKLNYPSDKLELLVVDDKSKDRTPEILEEWKSKLPHLHVLRTGEEIANLRGKVNALTQGLDAAVGEIVLITDADCVVNPEWVNAYVANYHATTGLVASITLLEVQGFFDAIQSLDWAYLLGMASGAANLGVPLSVIGNNMSIRMDAYRDVGGYRNIPFSVTEDHALFEAIWNKSPWKVKFPISKELLVMSKATPDFKTWWRQKHRWVKGGQRLKFVGYVIFVIGLLGNLAMVTAPFLLPLRPALLIIGTKCLADLLVILPVLARTRKWFLLKYFPVYEIYLPLFVFVMPIMIVQKNVKWKGRVYQH
jgi:cellulose synthase/poly-beta-1,6-N-acetylglucosamine synthase-like glycosyltransferase